MFNGFNAFVQNPMSFLSKRFNLPQGLRTPDEMINYLLQSGQLSQDQINKVYEQYKNMQGNGGIPPFFK